MSLIDDQLLDATWSCVAAVRVARDHTDEPRVRELMLSRALDYADRAWALYLQKYDKREDAA